MCIIFCCCGVCFCVSMFIVNDDDIVRFGVVKLVFVLGVKGIGVLLKSREMNFVLFDIVVSC